MKRHKFDISTGISAVESPYHHYDRGWYWIMYPTFGYCEIKRVLSNEKGDDVDICSFMVAYQVQMMSCFWPVDCFESFMKRVKDSDIDIEMVFSGRKPPLTTYLLDDVIQKAKTYKKTIEMLREIRPQVSIRFNPLSFCGADAIAHPTEHIYCSHHDRFAKYLEPPKRIKDMEAERKLREAMEQLGVEKCRELMI